MKEKSLKDRIRLFLKRGWLRDSEQWCNTGVIQRLAQEAGFVAANAARRCRELVNEGKIEVEERKNPDTGIRSCWYRYKPTREDLIKREMESKLST